jgi:type IV pilus assembly protein PilB
VTNDELENRLADLLMSNGRLTEAVCVRAREYQKTRPITFGRALVEMKLLSADVLKPLLEEITGATCVDPSLMTVYPDYVEMVSQLLPPDVVTQLMIFPVQSELNMIHVCMLNPTDAAMISWLEGLSGCLIKPLVCHEMGIAAALEQHYKKHLSGPPSFPKNPAEAKQIAQTAFERDFKAPFEQFLEPAIAFVNRNRDKMRTDPAALQMIIRDPSLIKLVNQILNRLVLANASDVHFEPTEEKFRIRTRIDGVIKTKWVMPENLKLPVVSRLKAMAGIPIEISPIPVDARIGYDMIWGKQVDFRFSDLPSLLGEKIVLRVLDRSKERKKLADLGFDPTTLAIVTRAADLPNGLILVTGPTGSGKSSTLYSLLDRLNDDSLCILTAEDPVESRVTGVVQVQCEEEKGLTFAISLRSFLRQDPDVIMVGEIRDQETADIALKSALTGHLVLSTLHTNDAPSTVLRLLNMGLEPFLIASALRLVLAQRLLRRLCPKCRKPMAKDSPKLRQLATQYPGVLDGKEVYEAGACEACDQTGYRGRTGIFEALEIIEPIEELIIAQKPAHEIRATARKYGMKTLRENALHKVAEGTTSLDEVLQNTVADFQQ